jgi:nucleotide-binding universal stress UspA family protein
MVRCGEIEMTARMQEGKVLVPWDFSDVSMLALHSALKIARDSSQIRALHVAAPLSGPDDSVFYNSTENYKIRELCQRFQEQVCDEEFQNVLFHVSFGRTVQEIIRFAENYKVRLIVIASGERKGLARFSFGGLPERIIRSCRCPVLVVQGNNSDRLRNCTRWPSLP